MLNSNKFETLGENIKSYVNTNIELIKLQLIDQVSKVGGTIAAVVVLGVAALLVLIFAGIWAGFYLAAQLDSYPIAFGIVAGFFLFLFIILVIGRKKILKEFVRDIIIGSNLPN